MQQHSGTPVRTDPCVVLGRLAELLAEGASPADALEVLATGLGLRTAVLRGAAGELLGVGGEVLHAVPVMRAVPGTCLELPVNGKVAALSVVGARPSQLPALRAAAAILGLALAPVLGQELLDAAEQDRDELADRLHDGPVQSLVVARYAADAAVRGGDAVLARDAVQRSLVEVRRALWQLRPRGADGLVEALVQLSAQLVEAGRDPLEVVGQVELRGARAVLAYRLVQALRGPAKVVLRSDPEALSLEVTGVLPSPERWVRRARALGGDLAASTGLLRLVFPLTDARIPS